MSASELLHREGAAGPTLAEIAHAADVPPGNVYYYFKTRDELLQAVVNAHANAVEQLLEELDARPTPQARLKGLADSWTRNSALVVEHGCPLGSLAHDLGRCHGELSTEGARPLLTIVTWVERQFRELKQRDARTLAETFISTIQGAALLANAFGDARVLKQQIRRLERWVDDLS
jgi:TetR/AcrR family transcriptional regulator, transcriptional repressor for nem operon